MRLEELLKELPSARCAGTCRGEIQGIACDSRQVRPGYLFVAVKGSREDGWTYVADAVNRGAVAVVSEHEQGGWPNICEVRVDRARLAVASLAAAFHGHPGGKLTVAGVTGTNGKTTTAYMIRHILLGAGMSPGLISTVVYEIGQRSIPAARTTPDAPLLQSMLSEMAARGCRSVVMEVSSHALEQERTEGIDLDVGVFTNLSRDHLDYHKDMEAYFQAKRRLFLALGRRGKRATAVVNLDDPYGRRLLADGDMACSVVTYGLAGEAEVKAVQVSLGPTGSSFEVRSPWGAAPVRLGLLGRFNVSNALAAVAACGALGIAPKRGAGILSKMTRVPGRLEEVPCKHGAHVFVDYAHTDDALEKVLTALREITRGRLLAVFGCGGNRDAGKRPAMGAVAARLADYTVLTSDNPRKEDPSRIIEQISRGFEGAGGYEIVADRREAIETALRMAGRGDAVLIAGKGHEAFQEFADTTVAFDDRQVVREWTGAGTNRSA